MSSSRRRARREARERAAQATARAVSVSAGPSGTSPSAGVPPETATNRAEINRANALHSTGPRTPEGRARSRRDALTHGLYARALTGSADALGEDLAEFEALHESLVAEYTPEGLHEQRMVERMALLWWRLDRLSALAQQRLASALAGGAEVLTALLGSEAVAAAEGRLERAIARLHRDLLFLARYRQRTARDDARRRSAQAADRVLADSAAEADRMLQYLRAKRTVQRQGTEPQPPPESEPLEHPELAGPGAEPLATRGQGEESRSQTAA